MELFDIVFYLVALVAVVSGAIVVLTRNLIYAAFSLLFTLFAMAALYVLLLADFLAVTQVLVYVGGILVLLLFGAMLTTKLISVDLKTGTIHAVPALILVALVGGTLSGLFYSTWHGVAASPQEPAVATTAPLGELLMTRFVLPFEVASIILVVALIGATWTARRNRSRST
jgi:NADH-quinone oxidoreductase subunit J